MIAPGQPIKPFRSNDMSRKKGNTSQTPMSHITAGIETTKHVVDYWFYTCSLDFNTYHENRQMI